MIIDFDKVDVLKEKNDFGKDRIEEVKLILIQSHDCESAAIAYADISINDSKQPAHYVVDGEQVIKYAPFTTNLLKPNTVYTEKAKELLSEIQTPKQETIFDKVPSLLDYLNRSNPNDLSITHSKVDMENYGDNILLIEVCVGDKTAATYDKISQNLTKFIGYLMAHHGFVKDNFWRVGDIIENKQNPYQYYHINDFMTLLDNAVEYSKDLNSTPKISPYCFKADDHENSAGHCPEPGTDPEHSHSGHVHHWEADTRKVFKLVPILTSAESMHGEDFTSKTINGSIFEQSNFQPTIDQDFIAMESNLYEPIYPDLTVPPRNATSLYNMGVESTKQIIEKLTAKERVEELKKIQAEEQMQKSEDEEASNEAATEVDMQAIMEIEEEEKRKPVIGKIPNFFDPYPIDDKIVQLEHHAPMVTLEYEEASKVSDNLAFYVINRAINTEKRLVQLENIMTAQMRMLNRLSSRIKINCVYYGGQSVFDKYKCIRCLSDDLVNDAAQVTLDQCLNCSRYEPIEGQVYEIMDENLKPGEANLYDDIQASYMTKQDYVELTRVEEMNVEDDSPTQDLTKTNVRDEDDKDYNELLAQANNFVMNWERKPWDYQSPHINEYDYDFTGIALDKENRLDPDNKYEDGWRDIKQNKYQRPDYGTNTLGDGSSSSGYSYGSYNTVPTYFTLDDYEIDPSDLRFKIIEYAKQACEFGEQAHTFQYTFGAKIKYRDKTPDQLVAMALKGEEVSTGKTESDTQLAVYTDCSNFTNYIYYIASGGKLDIAGTTAALQESKEFKVIGKGESVLDAIKKAIPGDLILYRGVDSGHVAIYAGSDEMYHASSDTTDLSKQVCVSKINDRSDFYGILRHSSLSEPQLKSITFIDVNMTLEEYVKKYQCVEGRNTLDGDDNNYTTKLDAILKYVDPHEQFTTDRSKCQFALLTHPYPDGYITADGLAKYFAKKGKTKSMPDPQCFIDAGKKANINPLFIVASCAIETGWCEVSSWMNGSGQWKDPSNGKTLYNAYGLWCYNESSKPPKRLTAIKNCSEKQWYTPEKAVIEGAEYFGEQYYGESAEKTHGIRNTPYFMKWHFGSTIEGNAGTPGTMQYASDIRYAATRGGMMYDMMECMPGGAAEGMKHMRFLVPRFKGESNK